MQQRYVPNTRSATDAIEKGDCAMKNRGGKIWVDDVRAKPADYDIFLHSVNEVIAYLEMIKNDRANVLLDLDHDAGEYSYDGGDYIRILDWMEETGFVLDNPGACIIVFRIHSMNPVGRANMQKIIEKNGWPMML